LLRPVVLFLNPLHSSLPYLFDIARGSLTEHCCSHLLWLCYSAESGLITALVISLDYIYIIPYFVVFVKRFSKKSATFLEKVFIQEKVQFLFTSCRLGFLHRPNLLTHTSYPS